MILLLGCREVLEVIHHFSGLGARAGMVRDRRQQVARAAVVEEEYPLSQAPQGRGTELIAPGGPLRYVVGESGAHVVNLQVGEGVDRSTAQRRGDVGSSGSC